MDVVVVDTAVMPLLSLVLLSIVREKKTPPPLLRIMLLFLWLDFIDVGRLLRRSGGHGDHDVHFTLDLAILLCVFSRQFRFLRVKRECIRLDRTADDVAKPQLSAKRPFHADSAETNAGDCTS